MRRAWSLIPAVAVVCVVAGCAQPGAASPGGTVAPEPLVSASVPVVSASVQVVSASVPSTATEPSTPGVSSDNSSGALPASTSPAPTTPTPITPAQGSTGTPVKATSRPLAGCTPGTLKTLTAGTLTLATGPAPVGPWFEGNPAAGQGYEAAVAAAVAVRLGYDPAHVTWTTVDPAQAGSGTATEFDAFIDRQTIPDQPAAKVQYSTGYLDDSMVLLAPEGSAIAHATTLDDLTGHSLAVFGNVGGLGIPGPTKLATGPAAERAVDSGAIDGVIAPITSAQRLLGRSGLQVVGQVAEPSGQQARQLGMVIPNGSTVAPCISTALDTLRIEGTLTDLAHTWLSASTGPVIAAN